MPAGRWEDVLRAGRRGRGSRTVGLLELHRLLWPREYVYAKQRDMFRSVEFDDETFVVAGNELGKDWSAARIVLCFFLTRHPCRIVTTSAKDQHLMVLWGEIGNAINTASRPLLADDGGPLVLNHQHLRRVGPSGDPCRLSYCVGMVAGPNTEAALQGHHVASVGPGAGIECCGEYVQHRQARTMFVADEASSVPHGYYAMIDTWAKRKLIFGNPWPCDNFFKHAVEGKPGSDDRGGNLPRESGSGYKRRVIRIRAEDSPNVRYGLAQQAAGVEPDDAVLVPGVKGFARYADQRKRLDKARQTVVLDARFYKGKDVLLFPPDRLEAARRRGRLLPVRRNRRAALGIGVDPGEGSSQTSLAAVDADGPFLRRNVLTPDTSDIPGLCISFFREAGLTEADGHRVCIDRGGGGKQLADGLRAKGWPVRTVGFGEAVAREPKRGAARLGEKVETVEDRYAYKNRRAQLWGELSRRFDPAEPDTLWSIPVDDDVTVLYSELGPVPKKYDSEGRLVLLPKNRREADSNEPTLVDLIGHSPDEADALALANHAADTAGQTPVAGPLFGGGTNGSGRKL